MGFYLILFFIYLNIDLLYVVQWFSTQRHSPEVCDDGIQFWTVYDWQPGKIYKSHSVYESVGDKMLLKGLKCVIMLILSLILTLWAAQGLFSLWHCWLFPTLKINDCVHNVNVPARGVRAVRYVLCLPRITVKKSKVNLERTYEWISWRWEEDVC